MPSEIASQVTKLFYAFLYRPEPDMYRGTIAAYIEKLEIFPLWVIDRARQRLSDQGGKFPPSAGDFKIECEHVLDPFGIKRSSAPEHQKSLPSPEISYSPVVAQGLRSLLQELAMNVENPEIRRRCQREPDSEQIRKDAEARLAELYAERDKPISLSPQALAIFRQPPNAPKSLEDLERDCLR